MANALFGAYKQVVMGDGAIAGFSIPDLEGGDQRLVLIDVADVDPDIATHQDLADISAAVVATIALSGESVVASGGVVTYDASDPTFTAVTGDQAEEIVLYEHTGTAGTSLLIVRYDTFSAGMPVTPNGGDIAVSINVAGLFSW